MTKNKRLKSYMFESDKGYKMDWDTYLDNKYGTDQNMPQDVSVEDESVQDTVSEIINTIAYGSKSEIRENIEILLLELLESKKNAKSKQTVMYKHRPISKSDLDQAKLAEEEAKKCKSDKDSRILYAVACSHYKNVIKKS